MQRIYQTVQTPQDIARGNNCYAFIVAKCKTLYSLTVRELPTVRLKWPMFSLFII